MMARWWLFIAALASPAAAHAQSPQSCPWLNAGTAAKALGASVSVSAHSDSNWSGSCRFVTGASSQGSIAVLVGKTGTHVCAAGASPLSGIGNQASLCSERGADGQLVQTVIGRVRDAWFAVTLRLPDSGGRASPAPGESAGPSAVEFLAEQVAGNLY